MPRSLPHACLLALGLGGACGGPAAPPAPQPAPAVTVDGLGSASASASAPALDDFDAFALPGLREHAPAPRLAWPVESVHITSSFGWRVDPVSGAGTRLHRGIDLRGAPGDLVSSIGAGRVAFVGHDPMLGNLVVIDHGEGLESYYGHLSDVLVVADIEVDRGAAIGLVGNTGRSAAPHLHLTVKLDGVAIDPLELLGEPQYRPRAVATPLEALEPAPPAPEPTEALDEGTTSGPAPAGTDAP